MSASNRILVTGGTGKTGRRIVERLKGRDVSVRIGSRSAQPPFDWTDQTTWGSVLTDIDTVYMAYQPDVAIPGAVDTIRAFTEMAVKTGVNRLVLLTGRGEEEAQRSEQIVQNSGVDWTILRASWFAQNFSESFLLEALQSDTVYLPVGDVKEPFIDAEDIADVAVAALVDDGHTGQLYELTGPRMLTVADAVAEIAGASKRPIRFAQIAREDYAAALKAQNIPENFVWLVDYLFSTVLDGRNAYLTDGVQRALGREPKDFSAYVQETAATGIWSN